MKAVLIATLWCFCTAATQPQGAIAVLAAWRARVAEAAAKPRPVLTTLIANELHRRVVIDQAARTALADLTADLPAAQKQEATQAIWAELGDIDSANSAYVETILPATGWFEAERDGRGVSGWAWLIVQHSPNWQLKRDALVRLAPLVKSGLEPGSHYALLHDRLALHDGRPQRFGSQLECRDGRYQPTDLEDAANVDARRAALGLEPLAEYIGRFGGRC